MSLRRDGYSAFGIKNPRAWFPAAAFAWVVSNEKFFKSDLISRLKLRTSWGANGNRDIGAYAALAQLASVPYYNGSQLQVGVTPSTLANYDLKWERTTSANVGIDLEMLNGKVRASVDAYDMTTTNLLMNRLLPRITGYSSVTSNLGELGNKGMEVSIETINKDNENFKWSSGFVFSFNRNKIKKLFTIIKQSNCNILTHTPPIHINLDELAIILCNNTVPHFQCQSNIIFENGKAFNRITNHPMKMPFIVAILHLSNT